jgi:SlyX protein
MADDITLRIQVLEEKFAHQERMLDALNEVIIDQQTQIATIEEEFRRFRALVEAVRDRFPNGQDPPPPHY